LLTFGAASPQSLLKPTFDTLAQNETDYSAKPAIIVTGKGSDLNNDRALKGRSKRKVITQKMVLGLIDVADKFGADERKKVIGILTIVKTKSILPTADYTGNTAKIDFMQYAAVLERHTSLINTCLLLKPGTSHILLR
jgi:Flp pilus assembly CpaE family ATPase